MKICFFSKYPPIEGGVSAQTYWLSKALGEKGIEIHIITNALEVEEAFKEKMDLENSEELKNYLPTNVFVHNLESVFRNLPFFHIPQSPAYIERLISKGLEVIKNHQCDLIDSFYLLPYGLAGFFTKILTGKPQIFRHAGSDVSRLFLNPELKIIFRTALNNADRIVTSRGMSNFFQQSGINASRLHFQKWHFPCTDAFNPEAKEIDIKKLGINIQKTTPLITYLGKYNKQYKGLYELAEALNSINADFFLVMATGGRNIAEFESYLANLNNLRGKYKIIGFLPPWHIPGLIKRSNCIIQLENNFPIQIHSPVQLQETMAVGKTCLISDELYGKFREKFKLEDGKNVLVANPKDQNQLKEKLKLILAKPEILEKMSQAAYNAVDWQTKFDEYIKDNLNLYKKAVNQEGVYVDKALELYEKIIKKIKFS